LNWCTAIDEVTRNLRTFKRRLGVSGDVDSLKFVNLAVALEEQDFK